MNIYKSVLSAIYLFYVCLQTFAGEELNWVESVDIFEENFPLIMKFLIIEMLYTSSITVYYKACSYALGYLIVCVHLRDGWKSAQRFAHTFVNIFLCSSTCWCRGDQNVCHNYE